MKLRFLRTTPSETPDFPFQPGQVIYVDVLDDEMRKWVDDGSAEVVRDDSDNDSETTDAPDVDRAVTKKGRR